MSEEAFAAALEQASNVYNNSTGDSGFSSKVKEKEATLFDKTLEKKSKIYGQAAPITVQSIPDGDGYIPVGGSERRMVGYDAYEVQKKDDEHRKDLSIQKQKIAQETGVPYEQITDNDVYERGNRDKLNNLYEMVRKPGDAPWTPGPTTADSLTLGSKENPLDIAIRERQEGTGTHGRVLASAFNSNTMDNVNEQMYTDSNALHFRDQKSKNGKYVPDTEAMELQNAATFLNQQQEQGLTTSPEQIAAFNQSNDLSRSGREKNLINDMYSRPPATEEDGRQWSNAKGIAAGVGNIVTNVVDTGLEAGASLAESSGMIDEETKKAVGALADSDLKGWQKFLNVNTSHVDAANKELADSVADGRYVDAAESIVKNLDIHLAQSAPEMGALMLKVPGFIAAVNSRVKDVSAEFTKDRGREPTAAEEAGMWATAAVVLVPEKFLLIGPLKSIFQSSKAAYKAGGKAKGFMSKIDTSLDDFIPKGKTIWGSTKAVGLTMTGEAVQEIADQAQETGWKEGRMITGDEAITAGMAGSVVGGALRGGVEFTGAKEAVSNSYKLHGIKKNFDNADKYLSDQDKEFAKLSLNNDSENHIEKRAVIKDAQAEMKKIRKSSTPIDDMSESKNEIVREFAKGMKVSHISLAGKSIDFKGNTKLTETLSKGLKDNTKALGILGIKPDSLESMSKEDINKSIAKAMESDDKRAGLYKSMSDDIKIEIFDNHAKESFSKKEGQEIGYLMDQKLTANDAASKSRISNNEVSLARMTKTKGSERKQGKIDSKDWATSKYPTLKEFLSTPFSRNEAKAKREINKFDNDSIRDAIKIAESPKKKKWLKDVLENRKKAQASIGIGGKSETKLHSPKYEAVKKDESLGKTKIETVESLKAMLRRTEYKDLAEVNNAQAFIKKAFEAKHINEKQKQVLEARLKKINAKTKLSATENSLRSKQGKAKAAEIVKNQKPEEKKADGTKGETYRFKDKHGVEHEADIIDISGGTATVGTDEGMLTFDEESGEQLVELGEEKLYSGGRVYDPAESTTDGSETAENTEAEEGFDEEEEMDQEMIDAAEKANLESLGEEFDPENLTEEQLENLVPELRVLFDC